ncbi:MAG TPA: DUF4392 domain-containing protein [Candidatus Limnocylindria bacterium]|nr:DUF4392 domain-containing protein [Candidatus Limnocylindria bacterium]
MPALADPIDHLLALDPGGRGIGGFFVPGGALAAATALRRARRVLIVTGFVVAEGASETDGPPGAAVLGRALRRLGADVRYVTDAVTRPLLVASLGVLDEPQDVLVYPAGPDAARRVMAEVKPSHLVAIERPGRCRTGDYLNARGLSVAHWNPPLDELFMRPPARVVTIGVGDGGNEIGMGNARARIVRQGSLMARIAATVKVNHLVVAGVSNWGAYGIVAQLARLAGTPLVHSPELERRMIHACVEAGGHDGLTRRREPTVDGLPMDTHAAMVELLGVSWKRPGGRSA